MKTIFRSLLLSLVCIAVSIKSSNAQSTKEENERAFVQVVKYINEREGDSVYVMLNGSFKVKYTNEVFNSVLETNLYPLGKISTYDLVKYNNGMSYYKVTAGTTLLEFRIALDDSEMIASLRFLPYKETVGSKTAVVPTDNSLQTKFDRQVDTIARRYINKMNTVGMSIAILKNGYSYFYGYGATEKKRNHVPGNDAIFEIGSISKTFTATLLAYYANEHKLFLTDPITKYLPDSLAADTTLQHITLQMLANHTSGLPRLPNNLLVNNATIINPYESYSKQDLFTCLKGCKLQSVPGDKYSYSNLGAGLLAVILERVSGRSYEQMITDIICKPLVMNSTVIHPDSSQKLREVSVYNDNGAKIIMWGFDALSGAGAIRSTSHDMLLYAQENLQDDKTNISKAITLTHTITYDKEMTVGLGWHMTKEAGMNYYWHNGATGGCTSYMAFIPEKNTAVVVLSNSAASVDDTGIDLLKMVNKYK